MNQTEAKRAELSNVERRVVELRAVAGAEAKMTIEGYAIIFDRPATQKSGKRSFTEVVKSGALDKTDIKDVPMRYNHEQSYLIMARTRNKSLRLIVDAKGLKVEADLLDTQSNRDLYKAIQEGLVDKMSFAFTVAALGETWTYGDTNTLREITAIERLYDVSVVDTPFYDSTSISARALSSLEKEEVRLDSLREIELLKERIKLKGKI